MTDRVDAINEYLSAALDIGERMLKSGAEVNRVEDTITRVLTACGADWVDVFTITSSIVVTVTGKAFGAVTQTRRIEGTSHDLNKLDLLNALSRSVCEKKLTPEEIKDELLRIDSEPRHGMWAECFIYALISAAFSLFFGGSVPDAVASAVIGFAIRLMEEPMKRMNLSRIFSAFVMALTAGLAARAAVLLGLANNSELISIGNIMLLIPGIPLTNAVRDMFEGDTIAGLARFAEAILLANIVVLGVSIAALML